MKADKKPHPLERRPSDSEIMSQAYIFPLPGKRKRKYPLRLILILLIPILAIAGFAIYNRFVRFPGQDKLIVMENAQQVGYVHTDENVLNIRYELIHWTDNSVQDVLNYYDQYAILTEHDAEASYHLIYLTVPDDGETPVSATQDEVRRLQDCRLEASLQKIENCYSVILVDLTKTAGYLAFQGLPEWVSEDTLPDRYQGTLIYHQWWTAKAY